MRLAWPQVPRSPKALAPCGEGWGGRMKTVIVMSAGFPPHLLRTLSPPLEGGAGGVYCGGHRHRVVFDDVPRAHTVSKLRYFNARQLPFKLLVQRRIERPLRLTQSRHLRPDFFHECCIDRIKNFDCFHIEVERTANVINFCLTEPFNVCKDGARNDLPSILKQHNRSGLCPKSDLAITVFSRSSGPPRQLNEEELVLDLRSATAHKARLLLRVHW
jgi:hypothetical protein